LKKQPENVKMLVFGDSNTQGDEDKIQEQLESEALDLSPGELNDQ
jgi:hypothetical protein